MTATTARRARADSYMTGMQGVYLVAAELSRRGFIVSPTSRSTRGADLLVTDKSCERACSSAAGHPLSAEGQPSVRSSVIDY